MRAERAPGRARPRPRRRRAAFLAGAARSPDRARAASSDGYFPYQGDDDQGLAREPASARVAPDVDPDPSPRRRAPGPPRGLPADLEHVPRPPDPRIRDPQVGRRPRPAQLSTCRSPPRCWSARSSCCSRHFGTQRSKDWFDAETFRGLARLRGMECRAPERFAEAFTARKARTRPARAQPPAPTATSARRIMPPRPLGSSPSPPRSRSSAPDPCRARGRMAPRSSGRARTFARSWRAPPRAPGSCSGRTMLPPHVPTIGPEIALWRVTGALRGRSRAPADLAHGAGSFRLGGPQTVRRESRS